MLKVYSYERCSTCKKALAWLKSKGKEAQVLPIVEQPPSKEELKQMLSYVGDLKRLLNTSGELYREMQLSQKLPSMTQDDALNLLAAHGKLVKRPFVLGHGVGCVGFKEDEWLKKL